MLAVALVSFALATAFHNSLLRWITLRALQQVQGVEAQFAGTFEVTHIAPLTIDATDIHLTFSGDELAGTRSQFGKVHLAIRLWPLLKGVAHVEQLLISNADIEIPLAGTARAPERSPPTIHLPFIEKLRLERVRVRFERTPPGSSHELSIASLEVGESESGAVTAAGTASLDGHGLELEAELGSIEELLHSPAPFPVDARVRAPSWDLEAHVSGTLERPLERRGARLDVLASASHISVLRDLFLPEAPFAGAFDAKAHLSGALNALALSDLDLTIDDANRLRFGIQGGISSLQGLKGMDLRVDALSQDPEVTRYLTQAAIPALQAIRIRTTVKSGVNGYLLEDLDIEATGKDAFSASARGSLHLTDFKAPWPLEKVQLDLRLSTPAAELSPWLPEHAGHTGSLRLEAGLDGSAESLTLHDLALELDGTQPLSGRIDGKLAYTVAQLETIRTTGDSNSELWIPAEIDLSVDLKVPDLQSLSALLGRALPDLGTLSAKAQLRREGNAIRVTELETQTSGKQALN